MANNAGVRQRKNTAAVVVSIIELLAMLGMYLTLGITVGMQAARESGWIREAPEAEQRLDYSSDMPGDYAAEDFEGFVAEEDVSVAAEPEPVPEPVYCLTCGAQLEDVNATVCLVCGTDPYAESVEELTVTMLTAAQARERLAQLGLERLTVDGTWESSVVDQQGTHNNSASALVDNDLETSWQEGVDGDGLGESVMLDFGHEVQVQMVEMYLGNWRTDEWFYKNNVPSEVDLYCYGAADDTFETVTVYNEHYDRTTCWVEFSRPVPLQYLELYINQVYKGSKYDDTCIAEIVVYGVD